MFSPSFSDISHFVRSVTYVFPPSANLETIYTTTTISKLMLQISLCHSLGLQKFRRSDQMTFVSIMTLTVILKPRIKWFSLTICAGIAIIVINQAYCSLKS